MIDAALIENTAPAKQQAPALAASSMAHAETAERLSALRAYLRAHPPVPPCPPLPVPARILRSGRPTLAVVPVGEVAA